MCTLSETKLKGKGEVVGRMSGVEGGRGGPVTEWVVAEVCSGVEGGVISSRLMWVKVKMEQERWVFISHMDRVVRGVKRR